MRYDILIIWGNGLNCVPEIVDEIAIDSNFQVVRLKYHSFTNTESFIRDVYECDTVPWGHLKSKSKYLHTAPQKCMVIIVKNLIPREQMVGDGEFRHIQCQNITDLKTRIRSKYNPKFKNVNQQINPLPRGISHEHVIHATDYQSQTDYLLKYFNLNNNFGNLNFQSFKRNAKKKKSNLIKSISNKKSALQTNLTLNNYNFF